MIRHMSNINIHKVMKLSKSLQKYAGKQRFFCSDIMFAMKSGCIVDVMPLIKPDFRVESFAHG